MSQIKIAPPEAPQDADTWDVAGCARAVSAELDELGNAAVEAGWPPPTVAVALLSLLTAALCEMLGASKAVNALAAAVAVVVANASVKEALAAADAEGSA